MLVDSGEVELSKMAEQDAGPSSTSAATGNRRDKRPRVLMPLVLETDDHLINATDTGLRKQLSSASAGNSVPTPTLVRGELATGSAHRWMALAAVLAAFSSGAMSNALIPIAVDFLPYSSTLERCLKYGVVFAFAPAVTLMFIAPATWLGQLDQQSGGLSLLLIAFMISMGSGLASACASLVYHIQRFAVILVARGLVGIASACSSVAVISVVGSASTDAAQCRALMLTSLGFHELGAVFALLLSGTASIGGIRLGWQIVFCTLAALSGFGAVAVGVARHRVRVYTVPAQAYLPDAGDVVAVMKNPLVLVLTMNYMLIACVFSFVTVLGPLWLRHVFAPGPASWAIAILFTTRSVVFAGTLVLRCVQLTPNELQWRVIALATLVLPLSCICWVVFTSRAPHISLVSIPLSVVGVCFAIVEVNTFPILADILRDMTDLHPGGAQFLRTLALQIGLAIGPMLAVSLLSQFGFEWTFYAVAILLTFFVPFLGILKSYEDYVKKCRQDEVT